MARRAAAVRPHVAAAQLAGAQLRPVHLRGHEGALPPARCLVLTADQSIVEGMMMCCPQPGPRRSGCSVKHVPCAVPAQPPAAAHRATTAQADCCVALSRNPTHTLTLCRRLKPDPSRLLSPTAAESYTTPDCMPLLTVCCRFALHRRSAAPRAASCCSGPTGTRTACATAPPAC